MTRRRNIVRAAAGVLLLPACALAAGSASRDTGVAPVRATQESEPTSVGVFTLGAADTAEALVPRVKPLALQQDPYESIYLPPGPPREEEGVNAGGANFNLRISYLTDYVYRGVDESERLAAINEAGVFDPGADTGAEDAPNLQFEGNLELNLGRLPHPVAGVFANVFNDDPVSRFQEIRPYFGVNWDLRPLRIQAGQISYIFPERENVNTSEIWASVTFEDSRLWRTERPLLAPYVYGAYDYDLYDGFYLEAGVRHQFELEDTGIMVTAVADIAYVINQARFTDLASIRPQDTGFQHYDIGLIGSLSLNHALGIPRRYGQWTFEGSLYYTDNIDTGLLADTQVWGGVTVGFKY
jgi:hypothetical protein